MFVQVKTKAGAPVRAGEISITPVARILCLQLPGSVGGLIWNHPTAVVLRTKDGEEKVLPIRDITRQAQLAFLGVIAGLLVVAWLMHRKNKTTPKKEITR
jgi:hypothetical protein